MADILNQCAKCKCSLTAADKHSKLLPCLHTLCEDCLSGRTDALEKLKRLEEERVKTEETKCDDLLEPKPVGEQENTTNEPAETSNETSECDQTEKLGQNQDHASKSEEDSSQCLVEEKQTGDEEATLSKSSNDLEAKQVKEAEGKVCETGGDNTEERCNEDAEETATTTGEIKLGEEKAEMEGVEETPPEPVPLTECPACLEPFTPETMIENVFIRKSTPASGSEMGEGAEQKCTGCETNQACSFCQQCDDWLCEDCVVAHKRVRMTKDHKLTSVEEALANNGGKTGPGEVSMMCRSHPKEQLSLFCERCEVLTCRDCQLLHHQEHRYHFLQEAAETYKAKLSGSLSLMKDRREILKKKQTDIEERLSKVKKDKSDLQQDILSQADMIIKAVRSTVWSILSSLHSFTDAATKRLSREVVDVRDLVDKFDHCIQFMEAILQDGFGSPLLFSKSTVETKCRKVYHTHMEPQSLTMKGQLNIQYRHDTSAILRSLFHFGAIYVNGTKYPPEKSSSQSSSNSHSSSNFSGAHNSASGYRPIKPQNRAMVGNTPQSSTMVQPTAHDRRRYVQMPSGSQAQPNVHPSQGAAVLGQGSRPVGTAVGGWGNQAVGLTVSKDSLVAGLMARGLIIPQQPPQQQQQQQQRSPHGFAPMRLHHRPVEARSMPTVVAGVPSSASQSVSLRPILPALPTLHGVNVVQYPALVDASGNSAGGLAAVSLMSGARSIGVLSTTSPDLAHTASGGHNTPASPLSTDGSASGSRVKSEPVDSSDCVITSANFKGEKASCMPAVNVGEAQNNLDEVIRNVPLDMGDNLEQISSTSLHSISTVPTTEPPTAAVSSPTSTTTSPTVLPPSSDVTDKEELCVSAIPVSASDTAAASASGVEEQTETEGGEEERGTEKCEDGEREVASAEAEQSDVSQDDGHQVKGYTTGNSMPGFTLSGVETVDPNDDYCAACHQGGDVLCCDKCPRVFHLQCHVPVLAVVPSGAFVCKLCEEGLLIEGQPHGPAEGSGKRKAPTGLSDRDLGVCERILLELFCHPSSIPFHEPVNRAVPNYYKIITSPMDFTNIKCKLTRSHFNHYATVQSFLDDCKLVFHNCAVYNAATSEVGKAGNIVSRFFEHLVSKHVPELSDYVRRRHSSDSTEPERKRRRMTPSPGAGQTVHKGKAS